MSKQVYHKAVVVKVKAGLCPIMTYCGIEDVFTFWAKNWKDVTCGRCYKLRKLTTKKPRASKL